jgi:hypothetical protein
MKKNVCGAMIVAAMLAAVSSTTLIGRSQTMGVAGADFDALVQDLVAALDHFKVGAREKEQLLGALGPMKRDIVEKK